MRARPPRRERLLSQDTSPQDPGHPAQNSKYRGGPGRAPGLGALPPASPGMAEAAPRAEAGSAHPGRKSMFLGPERGACGRAAGGGAGRCAHHGAGKRGSGRNRRQSRSLNTGCRWQVRASTSVTRSGSGQRTHAPSLRPLHRQPQGSASATQREGPSTQEGYCCRRNGSPRPVIHTLKPNPPVCWCWEVGLWEAMRSCRRGSRDGMSVLMDIPETPSPCKDTGTRPRALARH